MCALKHDFSGSCLSVKIDPECLTPHRIPPVLMSTEREPHLISYCVCVTSQTLNPIWMFLFHWQILETSSSSPEGNEGTSWSRTFCVRRFCFLHISGSEMVIKELLQKIEYEANIKLCLHQRCEEISPSFHFGKNTFAVSFLFLYALTLGGKLTFANLIDTWLELWYCLEHW